MVSMNNPDTRHHQTASSSSHRHPLETPPSYSSQPRSQPQSQSHLPSQPHSHSHIQPHSEFQLMQLQSEPHPQSQPHPHSQSPPRPQQPQTDYHARRKYLEGIALSTVEAINGGIVDVSKTKRNTRLYTPDAPELVNWRQASGRSSNSNPSRRPTNIAILPISTIEGARQLYASDPHKKIGVLNFASATRPGGGFLEGARAQEESIARASTLYVSLTTSAARPFYAAHDKDEKGGFYSHGMIYSPYVHILRDDAGAWIDPFEVDVLTSPAVNAGKVRKVYYKTPRDEVEYRIQDHMKERMARILALFEKQGARNLVLGSFGTGVFRNDIRAMTRIWRDLLQVPGARFATSFENIIFTIPDGTTRQTFESVFNMRNLIPVQL